MTARNRTLAGAALAVALLSPAARAQSTPPAVVPLGPLVVTATRRAQDALTVPAAVDVIDASQIRRAQPRINLSETLQRVPGVVARNRQNYAQDLQISIRGFGARSTFGVRGVQLYNDDIPATSPDGQGQVSHFTLESTQRIEVLRGPFSALYGNASGGVIALFTEDAPAHARLGAGLVVGSDGLRRSNLSWHAPWGDAGEGDVLLDAVDLDVDGYRRHSAARRRTAQALVRGDLATGGRFTVLLDRLDLSAQDPQGLTAAQVAADPRAASQGALQFDTRKRVRQDQAGLHLEQPLSTNQTLVLTANGHHRRITQMLSVPVFVQRDNPLQGGGALALDRTGFGLDARWRWTPGGTDGTWSLVGGIDYQVSDESRRGFENHVGDRLGVFGALRRDEDDRVASRDAYAQAEWAPTPRWRVDLGVRHSGVRFRSRDHYVTADNPDDSGRLAYSRTSPVAGVLYRATPWLSVYANAGSGFETPTFSELAYRSDGRSGLNDGLQPSRSRNVEAGVRADRDNLDYSAAVFQSVTRDELIVVANQGGRSVYGNAGLSRRRGLELSVAGKWTDRWHYAAAYTFLDARYRRDFAVCDAPPCAREDLLVQAGRRIPGLSRHSAWGEVRWSPIPDADIVLQGQVVDAIAVDDANSALAPGHARFDLGVERRFRWAGLDWRGFARIDNLADRHYVGSVIVNDGNGRYFEPAPGRGFVVGLSLAKSFD